MVPQAPGPRRVLHGALAAVAAVVLLCGVVSLLPSKSGAELEQRDNWGSHDSRDHHMSALASEEADATKAEKEMLRAGPLATKTEDDYIAARARVASLRAKLRDNLHMSKHLGVLQKARNEQVKEAMHDRKGATMVVSNEETALKDAQQAVVKARNFQKQAQDLRAESEKTEAQGLALQRPAASLLKDSQKLNDQSNLVLDQSKSAQAKALASLDLKLAQNLADRASKGMAKAKSYFASAIDDRKEAVHKDNEAAAMVQKAASVSLKTNTEQPDLLHVMHGQVTGDEALADVISDDTAALDKAEQNLGKERRAVSDARLRESNVAKQVAMLADQAEALRKELATAGDDVLNAAKAHLAASKQYKTATAQSLQAQTQVDDLRASQVKELRAKLVAAKASSDKSSDNYKSALEKMAQLKGKQTVLSVRVARLKLQLKEAQMQRDDQKTKAAQEQQTINNMQAQLDKQDGDLNEARLRLADSRMAVGLNDYDSGYTQPQSANTGGVHKLAAMAEAEAEKAGNPADVEDALDRQRRNDQQLEQQEAQARQRAVNEEAKLKAAQQNVAKQLAKVTNIEGSGF